ncbi:MAG: hypothetical protein AAGM84_05075 [Pseudomonadota bacterium]
MSIALALVLPVQALALSCRGYGVTDAYLRADAAQAAFVPVLGALQFDPDLLPAGDPAGAGDASTLLPARFEGVALTRRGIDRPFSTDVVLEVMCTGPWCPRPEPGAMLGFLRRTSHSYVLVDQPCGAFLFNAPSAAQERALRDCIAGRGCPRSAP